MIRRWFIKYLTNHLLKAVTVDDLLRLEDGKVYIGKRLLKSDEIERLKIEAKSLETSQLWDLILKNVYWIANFKMIKGEKGEKDLLFGRAMTHNIEVILEFIDKIKLLR